MLAAEQAVRAWVNGNAQLAGEGNPLAGGAFLRMQRSPAEGAYAVLARSGGGQVVAEPAGNLATALITMTVYAPMEDTAETAAAALATAVEQLSGAPQVCGDTGVLLLVADNLQGPAFVPQPPDTGEPYCFTLSAEFTLCTT